MVRTKWVKTLALVLTFVVPMALMSAEMQGAILYATKSAIVNGSQVFRTAAIMPGDKLSVPSDSDVTINLKGTSILVPRNSSLVFTGNAVQLEPQAAVAVTTKLGMSATIANLKISPVEGAAQYQVARYNGHVYVAAKQGTVLMASAAGSRVIPAGTSVSIPDPEPQNTGRTPTATTGVSGMPTWVATLIAFAAPAAAFGIAYAVSSKSVSPSAP